MAFFVGRADDSYALEPPMPSPRPRTRRTAGRVALPDVEPIVPVERPTPFNDPAWVFEPKHDGFRSLVYITPDGCTIRSKRANTFRRFDALCGPLRDLVAARTAILDGEVLALDAEGRPQFMDLLRGKGRLAFAAFDILWLDGQDLRPLPLTKRKAHLNAVLPYESAEVYKTMVVEEHGFALFEAVKRLDLEGIVAKRKVDPYGPTSAWYKILNPAYSQKEGRGEVFERRR
jgi:bifunctional non-homologous end joining protein LigD